VCGLLGFAAACSGNHAGYQDVQTWREAISRSTPSGAGCFHASYPNTTWEPVTCGTAPARLYVPRQGAIPRETVGNGNDYAAVSSGRISRAVGSFPSATGVAGETDEGAANDYSIQLNSNLMSNTDPCEGVSGCQSWQQFVYASGEQSAFMQSWLFGLPSCPRAGGWISAGGGSCVVNSKSVNVPVIPSAQLGELKMSGSAVAGGNDTLVFTVGTEAYSTSEPDSVAGLAQGWTSSEFNVIGDGGGSQAVFSPGASITVNLAITDGTGDAPTCASNGGTTGETNNLSLGSCVATGGADPSIQFTQSSGGGEPPPSADAGAPPPVAPDAGPGGQDAGEDGGDAYAVAASGSRKEARHHTVGLPAGASRSFEFAWHDTPGVAAPADLSLTVDGRMLGQVAYVGDSPFVRAGLDVVPIEQDAAYRLVVAREKQHVTMSLERAGGEVLLTSGITLEEKVATGPALLDVVLPGQGWREAVTLGDL
jgi:hypothetical protein